jgi:DNA-binding NarL/FixJ family response regulator
MSTHESGDYVELAVAAGALGFVPKSQFSFDTLSDTWNQSKSD